MIPRLFLDYLPTYLELQTSTSYLGTCQVNTILPNLLVSPIRDQTRCQTILHNRSRVLLLRTSRSPPKRHRMLVSSRTLCSRMPSPPLQSFFTPNPTTRAIARRRNVATLYSRVKQATSFSQVAYCTTFSLPIQSLIGL